MYKFLDIIKGNFVTFLRPFLEKLAKNYPKNRKLFWENFEIIWRNEKMIILGTFWEFLGKYVHQVHFVKHILNYLLKNLIFRIKKKISIYRYRYWKFFDIDTAKSHQSFEPLSTTSGENRHMPHWLFCWEFNSKQLLTFTWTFFPLEQHSKMKISFLTSLQTILFEVRSRNYRFKMIFIDKNFFLSIIIDKFYCCFVSILSTWQKM